jgi:hypothetical protein
MWARAAWPARCQLRGPIQEIGGRGKGEEDSIGLRRSRIAAALFFRVGWPTSIGETLIAQLGWDKINHIFSGLRDYHRAMRE